MLDGTAEGEAKQQADTLRICVVLEISIVLSESCKACATHIKGLMNEKGSPSTKASLLSLPHASCAGPVRGMGMINKSGLLISKSLTIFWSFTTGL